MEVTNPRRSHHCVGGNSFTVVKERLERIATVCELRNEALPSDNAFVVLEPGGVVEEHFDGYWVDLVWRNSLVFEKRLKGVYARRIEMPIGS